MIISSYLLIFLTSFIISFLSIPILEKISFKYNILQDKNRKVFLIGGCAMGSSFIVLSSLFLWLKGLFSVEAKGLIVVSALILVVGLWDDFREIRPLFKFILQILCVSILIGMKVRTYIAGLPQILNIFISFLWIVGLVNAFNLLDVVDGLSGGCAIICCLGFLVVALIKMDLLSINLCLILMGVLLSFFVFNFPPAKIYMGNTGSHFLGFVLAGIAMIISYASPETKWALFSPLLIMGFPIFDIIFVVLARILKGISPFKKTDDHFILIYIRRGYSLFKALMKIYLVAVIYVLGGISLTIVNAPLSYIILAFFTVFTLYLLIKNLRISLCLKK